MSDRGLKRLVGALVVVVAIWLVTSLLSGGDGSIRATGDIAGLFDDVSRESITGVRVSGPSGEMELRRANGAWRANGFEADTSAISRLLSTATATRVGDLAATNPANHERMGVSADSAVVFELEVDGVTRTLLVGKQGPRFATAYGRLPDDDQVYLLEGDLRVQLRRPLTDWRNKDIVTVDSSLVARIEIERDGDAYTLVRGDSTWTLEDGGEADPTQVRNVLSELTTVLAAGFLTEGDSLYALPPGGSNVAYSAAGDVLSEVTIGTGEGERWARAAGDSVVYRLSTFRVGRLAPTLDEIRSGGG